jgi:hypothetical protein
MTWRSLRRASVRRRLPKPGERTTTRGWLWWFATALLIAVSLGGSCPQRAPLPPEVVSSTFNFSGDLGGPKQGLNYRWLYYAGNPVTSFRIQLGNTNLPWGSHVNLMSGSGQLVQRLEGSIGGWSDPIDGNKVMVQIVSGVSRDIPQPQITAMEYTLRRGPIFPEETPLPARNYDTARSMSLNQGHYGYLRGDDFTDYYVAGNLRGKAIDLVLISLDGADISLFTHWEEFLPIPDRAVHNLSASGGGTAFVEIDSAPRSKLYLTVKSQSGAGRYCLMVNHVQLKLPISYEFEGGQFSGRVHTATGKTYFQLVTELAPLASRQLYDSTDGRMRFDVVTVYRSERDFTVGDVYIHDESGYRANANSWDIDIGRDELENADAATIVHEWGHYEWGLPDEYEDVGSRPWIRVHCPNSMMANLSPDFCIARNHDPNGRLGGDSMWDEIWDHYRGSPNQIPRQSATPGAERFPELDLTSTITWRIFP